MFKKIGITLGLVAFLGCAKASDNSAGNNGAQGAFQAICDLSNSSNVVVCIDFQGDSSANQASCNGGSEFSRYVPEGVSSAAYVTISGAGVSCSQNSGTAIGSCALSDRTLVYYAAAWSLSSAQGDCSSRGGQFSN